MFYLNWKDNCKIYKNQFKYWPFNFYFWRYDGSTMLLNVQRSLPFLSVYDRLKTKTVIKSHEC
jgi:hypothetical protein